VAGQGKAWPRCNQGSRNGDPGCIQGLAGGGDGGSCGENIIYEQDGGTGLASDGKSLFQIVLAFNGGETVLGGWWPAAGAAPGENAGIR